MIPSKYWEGAKVITEDQLDSPDKIRLSEWERFILAEATWRLTLDWTVKNFLEDVSPECVVREHNRTAEVRFLVRYVGEPDSDDVKHAVTTRAVGVTCPTIVDDYKDWG